MIASERVLKGSTTRITAAFGDDAGEGVTGLTPTIRVYDRQTDRYLRNDGTWVTPAPVGQEYAMVETDPAGLPGVYHFDFTLLDVLTGYDVRADGGAGACDRYQDGEFVAVESDESELHTAFAMLANRRVHTISTGVDVVMDNDGVTPLRTMTPTDGGDDTITVEPS